MRNSTTSNKTTGVCKRCGVTLTRWTQGDTCRHCKIYFYSKNKREMRRKNGLCVYCGQPSEKITTEYPDGRIEVKHAFRCWKCRKKFQISKSAKIKPLQDTLTISQGNG